MGFFSNLFGGSAPSVTKYEITSQVASVIDYVIADAGFNMLLQGTISLSQDFKPNFRSGRDKVGPGLIAVVHVADLQESDFLKNETLSRMKNKELLAPFVDQLAYAVARKFESTCQSFADLPD